MRRESRSQISWAVASPGLLGTQSTASYEAMQQQQTELVSQQSEERGKIGSMQQQAEVRSRR
jgi:hypothetical protein